MPKYPKSDGTFIDKKSVDRKITKAKEVYSQNFIDEHGYIYCERCKKNPSGCPGIARSHIISVKECQNNGTTEISWMLNNIELLGQTCHREIEDWTNEKRAAWYFARSEGLTYKEFIEDCKS